MAFSLKQTTTKYESVFRMAYHFSVQITDLPILTSRSVLAWGFASYLWVGPLVGSLDNELSTDNLGCRVMWCLLVGWFCARILMVISGWTPRYLVVLQFLPFFGLQIWQSFWFLIISMVCYFCITKHNCNSFRSTRLTGIFLSAKLSVCFDLISSFSVLLFILLFGMDHSGVQMLDARWYWSPIG